MSVSYNKAIINITIWSGIMAIEHCKIIVVSTTLSDKDGFSHLPVLNYCALPIS